MAESILAYISGTRFFPIIGFVQEHTNINFHYRTNSVKINDQIFFKFKNTYFWPICPILEQKKFFLKILAFSHITSLGFLGLYQNSSKSNDPIPKIHPDIQQDRRIDKPYFVGSFWITPGANKYNCSRLTFKSQRYRV